MNISETIVRLLHKRGITDPKEIEEFLSPSPRKTYDPFLLKGMKEGVDLMLSEIKDGSRICIYGDYDADGVTSTALMLSILGYLTEPGQLDYYIPSRFEEGYGLNKEAIHHIYEQGFHMIITVDCGSVSYEEVEYAKELGMKVLVTDHHNITDTIADCILINPKQPGCIYPFKELAGCGVAFKVAQALQQKAGLPKTALTEVLDLVCIGTVGDIMPLVDENRTMVKFGMKIVNTGRRAGLSGLVKAASLTPGKITSENVSYVIVPHLNASGRMEDASIAVELLRYDKMPDDIRAKEDLQKKVDCLVHHNAQRKKVQQNTFVKCVAQLQEADGQEQEDIKDFIVIKSEDAHEGIAGIVAGKMKETYYRPCIIVTPSGEDKQYLKGTGRSIDGVNLYDLLKQNERLFEKFGGHAGACGFLMKKENLSLLEEGLLKGMAALKAEHVDLFEKKYDIDLYAGLDVYTVNLAKELDLLAPFGNANPKPLFYCSKVWLEDVRFMGDQNQHVRFMAKDQAGRKLQCVLFQNAQHYLHHIYSRRQVDLIGTLECQLWQGSERLQFLVNEIRFDEAINMVV